MDYFQWSSSGKSGIGGVIYGIRYFPFRLAKCGRSCPKVPAQNEYIPRYDEKSAISFESACNDEPITWIKPNGLSILVTDRVLLSNVSLDDLDKNHFVRGKTVTMNGQKFRCRVFRYDYEDESSDEWANILSITGKDDSLWHWNKMYFLEADKSLDDIIYGAVRGCISPTFWTDYNFSRREMDVGFRPVLEPMGSSKTLPKHKLDGMDFQLTSLPGDSFCPILQPVCKNIFMDIPAEEVRMYTFVEGQRPIHVGESIKDPTRLTLTDRYFGDEYLVPWVISNGIAVASRAFPKSVL